MADYRGLWWEPNKKRNKLNGTLKLLDGKIELETEEYKNIFRGNHTLKSYDILNGKTIDGKYITLINCHEINWQSNLTTGTTKKIFVEKIIIGKHFKKRELIKFDRASLCFDLLDEWININGFKRKYRKNTKALVNLLYYFPKQRKINISKNLEVVITFTVTGPSISRVIKEQKITQKTYLQIKSLKKIHLDELYEIKAVLKALLSFATQKPVSEIEFKAFEEYTINGAKMHRDFEILDGAMLNRTKLMRALIQINSYLDFLTLEKRTNLQLENGLFFITK